MILEIQPLIQASKLKSEISMEMNVAKKLTRMMKKVKLANAKVTKIFVYPSKSHIHVRFQLQQASETRTWISTTSLPTNHLRFCGVIEDQQVGRFRW